MPWTGARVKQSEFTQCLSLACGLQKFPPAVERDNALLRGLKVVWDCGENGLWKRNCNRSFLTSLLFVFPDSQFLISCSFDSWGGLGFERFGICA